MLIYIDNPTYLRVYRSNAGPSGPKRTLVGRILKASYQFVPHKDAELASPEEKADVHRVIQIWIDGHRTKLRAEALNFPEIARRVAEYYATTTDDVEMRLISAAVLQMSRALRKVDQGAPASVSSYVQPRR